MDGTSDRRVKKSDSSIVIEIRCGKCGKPVRVGTDREGHVAVHPCSGCVDSAVGKELKEHSRIGPVADKEASSPSDRDNAWYARLEKLRRVEKLLTESKDSGLIEPEDEIPLRVMTELKELPTHIVKKFLFPKTDNCRTEGAMWVEWEYQMPCNYCGSGVWQKESKTQFMKDYLAFGVRGKPCSGSERRRPVGRKNLGYSNVVCCSDCLPYVTKAEPFFEQMVEEEEATNKQEERRRADLEIEDYLGLIKPSRVWNENISWRDRWKIIQNARNFPETTQNQIADELKSLPYDEFLQTPYWKAIAQNVRWRTKFVCEKCCRSGRTLHIHHCTYEHHGCEHLHLDDLICLCKDCHTEEHPEKHVDGRDDERA